MNNSPENPDPRPLGAAENSLSSLFPDRVPQLQPGFGHSGDLPLLYSPAFDQMSQSLQTHLMLKYGLLGNEFVEDEDGARDAGEAVSPGLAISTLPGAGLGANVRVNDPILDPRRRPQTETSSAVSGSNIVIGYNDFSTAGFSFGSSISYSNDGGRTFRQVAPSLYPSTGGARGGGDPVMAAGPNGAFYYAQIAFTASGQSTMGVTRSDDGGASWGPLSNATSSITASTESHDKEWLAVDNTNSPFRGNVYLSWTRFPTNDPGGLAFVRSTDGGRTWSQFKPIGTQTDSRGFVQGSVIGIGPNGEVYVAYADNRIPGLAIIKSTDGGQNFGSPVAALRDPSFRHFRNISGGFEINGWPSIAVDTTSGPNRGTIYLTVNAKPPSPTDESDVVLVKSTDGGATWSRPVRVNDDQTDTDQFQPAVAVAPDGTLGLMWYDRRNDPTNNLLIDVYMTTSSDGGATFAPNRRVTTANWLSVGTPFGARTASHGDYNQISAGELGFVLNWSDDRSGLDSDIYAAVIPSSAAQSPGDDFVVAGQTLSQNVLAGSSASFNVTAELLSRNFISSSDLQDFLGKASLEATPPYPGLTYALSLSNNQATLTVNTAPGTAPGTYPVRVSFKVKGQAISTGLRLTVYNPNEVRQAPAAITKIRDSIFQPKAVADAQNNLHVVAGADSARQFSAFGAINYFRFSGGVQVAKTTVVSDPNLTITGQGIGIDEAGNLTVVWRQFDAAGSSNIFLSRSADQGRTFSSPVSLARSSVASPVLAVSRAGVINVAYTQFISSTGLFDLFFTRSTDGGATFSPRANLTNTRTASVTNPAIALEQDAVDLVYFGPSTAPRSDIFFTRSTTGASFSPPVNLSITATGNTVAAPTIAIDRSDNIYVAYIKVDATQNVQDVFFTRSTNRGATFSAPIDATGSAARGVFANVPNLGIDSAGNIGLAFGGFTAGLLFPGGRDVFFAKSSDSGRSFSPAINVSNNIGLQVNFPVVITDNGQLAVLWEDDSNGNNQVWVVTP